MPEFFYRAVDKAGNKISGKEEAPSEAEVRMILRGKGIRPVSITQAGVLSTDLGALFRGSHYSRIPNKELSIFTKQMQVMVGSGVPLVQALEVVGEQASSPALRRMVPAMKEKVSQGKFLWEALSEYAEALPRIYIPMVRAGESAGAMETVLDRLTRYLEKAHKLTTMIKSALTYPVLVVIVGLGVVGGMVTFVIPKFKDMLASSGKELPAITQGLLDVSDFMVSNLLYIGVFVGVGGYLLFQYLRSNEGRAVLDRLFFVLPVFGPLTQKAGVARFGRTLGTLLGAGVPLIEAIEVCRFTIDNAVLEEAVGGMRREIEGGKTLGATVSRIREFPRMAVQLVAVGESTGNLETMLDRMADIYEDDVEAIVGTLGKTLEPFVLVVLGGLVGVILVAMYLPIFQVATTVPGS